MRIKELVILLCFMLIPAALASFVTYKVTESQLAVKPIGNFDDRIAEINKANTYDFLPEEMSSYILSLCQDLGVDPDLVAAILLNENPMLDTGAINKNTNNSLDVGLFQLNDRYLYTTFAKRYWKFKDVELNAFNWKHNAYIAIHHIHYLYRTHKVFDEVIMAYNCGSTSVMKNKIPDSTKIYLARAKRNYYLLKNQVKYDFSVPTQEVEDSLSNAALADNHNIQ